jgi:hypothetical protein
MGKISVKHYFNDRLKAESINGEKYRPLYVQIIRKLRTSQIRSAFVTEKITAEQLHTEKIQALCKQEATMIHAFFEFADKATDEFMVSKSKTNLGDLLDFFCCLPFWSVLEDITSGFITGETRINIFTKLRNYFKANTDFNDLTIAYILNSNVGLHAASKDGEAKFISLSKDVIKDFHSKGILTDKEAARFEFTELLGRYNYDKYRLPLEKNGQKNPNPHEFLTLYVWQREKPEILKYVEAKSAKYTRQNLAKIVTDCENVFINLFKKGYFEGWKTENRE